MLLLKQKKSATLK